MRSLLSVLIGGAVFVGLRAAQTDTSALTGLISDPTGALVQHASVKVTNQATGISASVATSDKGLYFVPDLRPGTYTISASHTGFKVSERAGVILEVGATTRVDMRLEVGGASEKVTVTAEAPLLQAETSDRGSVIDGQKIVELPLNGRDYMQLAQLLPGVLFQTGRLTEQNFKGGFSVNGNRVFMNAYQLDGLDNTSYTESYRVLNMEALQPSVDALQEFKIQTNGYAAEFGRSAGAVVNAVIKSGTNEIHGSAYEFHRHDHLDANNFFANTTGTPRPFHLRNQFGGTLGGPIRKNKTFIFGDYEGLRDRYQRHSDQQRSSGCLGAGPFQRADLQSLRSVGQRLGLPAARHFGLQRRPGPLLDPPGKFDGPGGSEDSRLQSGPEHGTARSADEQLRQRPHRRETRRISSTSGSTTPLHRR